MEEFEKAYANLNDAQKQAVDTTEGPVLVVAGPGTGKTQLLAVRTANILRQDPTILASNVLCLTFTDSAAGNMRERLTRFIRQDAYQVGIHTFHSFGSFVMSVYPEYFSDFRKAVVADELTTYRIREEILRDLPGNNPIAGRTADGNFIASSQLQHFISDAKNAALTPKDLHTILDSNQAMYEVLTPLVCEGWPANIRAKEAPHALTELSSEILSLSVPESPIANIFPLQSLFMEETKEALQTAQANEPRAFSKPFTALKDRWLEKDADGQFIFKGAKHLPKLRAATNAYEVYETELKKQGMVDFNDQIMQVLTALKNNPELRLNLQERYQYIMIDEYQDTNRAHLQLAQYLTDAPVHEGRPNILAVGDDDQAIFRFQGADIANIGLFESLYRDPVVIPLTTNYRSNETVLAASRKISTQIEDTLEKRMSLNKDLQVTVPTAGSTTLQTFEHESEHYAWIAAEIKRLIEKGMSGSEIAVLGRGRPQLDALVPYLRGQGIAMDYERRENVLTQAHIRTLLAIGAVIQALHDQDQERANQLLPDILSHPMWEIPAEDIWAVASKSYHEKTLWLDQAMKADGRLKEVCRFLLEAAAQLTIIPLEQMLDLLIGNVTYEAAQSDIDEDSATEPEAQPHLLPFISPFKNFFFGKELFEQNPSEYLTLLTHLSTLRQALQNYQSGQQRLLYLPDLLNFAHDYELAGLSLIDTAPHREDAAAVKLMTAHKSKGLEFEAVFILSTDQQTWGSSASYSNRFSYPLNLATIKPSDNEDDDSLRLLFVAMTRAKQTLNLCFFKHSEDGKERHLFGPLLNAEIPENSPEVVVPKTELVEQYESRWLTRHASVSLATKEALLSSELENYKLSATHMHNFLNVADGGPSLFLTQNLLHFPTSSSPYALYGTAIHATLRRTHQLVLNGKHPTVDEVIEIFKQELSAKPLGPTDCEKFMDQGEQALRAYCKTDLASFNANQRAEFGFRDQGVTLLDARLTGAVDRLDLAPDSKAIEVTDYKTGSAFSKWELPPSASEYNRIKLHKYRQQLLFYKLLVDGSSDWGKRGWRAEKGVLRFVEPDAYSKCRVLQLDYEPEELERFKHLVYAVWQCIINLNFPDTKDYEPTLAGIEAFEEDLLAGNI